MRTESESRTPSRESLQLIEECVELVHPDDPKHVDWIVNYARDHKARLAHDMDLIVQHLPPGAKILEIGAVPPIISAALKQRGFDLTCVDVAPERFETSARQLGLNILKCDIDREPLPLDDDAYEAVLFNEIFEHLRINLIFTMQQVFRVLRPNGLLFLSTPNLKSLRGLRNFLIRGKAVSCVGDIYPEYEKLSTIGHMGHVREYTTVEVVTFLQRIGFTVEKIIFRGTTVTSWKARMIYRVFPRLRPFVSYIARKVL